MENFMTFAKSIIALSTGILLSGCIVIATPSHADVHLQKELVLDAQTLKTLDINAGAGSLSIVGRDDIDEITVKADIYTSSGEELYELALSDSGKTAYLVAHNSSSSGITWGKGHRIDLEVIVPNSMMLDVTDGSGEMTLHSINANVAIKDGSGALTIKDINGQLTVTDGSGPINIHNINASINIKDGSGELVISKIMGNVNIEDGSGSIELTNIKGHVDIEDGSGSIEVIDVSGNANIDDGSGDLTVRKVTGVVTVEDGSGDINIENAGGLTILEAGSGRLSVKNVKGNFEIDS
jgi:DUF4097 and DUF4098 domain-containing protein YvlB